MKEFVQMKRLNAHDVVINVVIMGIIEKHSNDQFHYILRHKHNCVNIVDNNVTI